MAKRVLLMIWDGWGLAEDPAVSAIDHAHTPFYDHIMANMPNTTLEASGKAVGLPAGQMGNSEVGHMNLGAGRVVFQDLVRIQNALDDGSLIQLPAYQKLVDYCRKGKPLHLIGLLSDGGVHSHLDHLKGLLKQLKASGLQQQVYIHGFTDGRDTAPQSGLSYVQELEAFLVEEGIGQLASLVGRYYAMDRDKRWGRVAKAYKLLTQSKGQVFASATEALKASYASGITDEFMEPVVLTQAGQPIASVQPGDGVLFFNFRTDRGRQLTQALTQQAYPDYGMAPLELHFTTLTRYDETFEGVEVVFEKDDIHDTLGEVLSRAGKTQLRIAETEKYPHVTFFFNGGQEAPFEGEARALCPSPKVATYDLQPEMSAYQVRDAAVEHIKNKLPDFICLNFANPDMVGHTGVFEAAVKACETVDACGKAVYEAAHAAGYDVVILADHGNADKMREPNGKPHTAHTTALVPLVYLPAKHTQPVELRPGKLGDIAPTILKLMGLEAPNAMTGQVLLCQPETVKLS